MQWLCTHQLCRRRAVAAASREGPYGIEDFVLLDKQTKAMHGVLAKTHEMQVTEAIDRTNLGVGNDLGTDDLATVPGF